MNRPKTKILLDSGDPAESAQIKKLLGFLDGQTTNPSLIAKNPDIKQRVAAGHRLSDKEELDEYKRIVQAISPLVGEGGVSIEVYADEKTTREEMLRQAREMYTWIPNAYIKYPCTQQGLKAAETSVRDGLRVNMTLCFSQQQAAAVYGATKGARMPVYVSPFVGRLDDIGQNGMDLIKNLKRMFAEGDGHVLVLAASIRTLDHLLESFRLGVELATVPAKILEDWAAKRCPQPDAAFIYKSTGAAIPYEEIALEQPWEKFQIGHELTRKGLDKFAADYRATHSSGAA